MTKRTQISDKKLMEVGTAIAEGMTPIQAIRGFQFSKSTIYRAMRHYEKMTGKRLIGPSQVEKKRMRLNGATHTKKGNGGALVQVSDDWQRRALEAESREAKLRDELEHATDEAHTLQKIIITLGRAL